VPSRRSSASSDRSGRERRLYRQGSFGSQIGGSGIELASLGSRGNFSYRSRTPSGKSIRSRVATRAEYHEDLKPQLSQVRFHYTCQEINHPRSESLTCFTFS